MFDCPSRSIPHASWLCLAKALVRSLTRYLITDTKVSAAIWNDHKRVFLEAKHMTWSGETLETAISSAIAYRGGKPVAVGRAALDLGSDEDVDTFRWFKIAGLTDSKFPRKVAPESSSGAECGKVSASQLC